jgi:hypothetical protein
LLQLGYSALKWLTRRRAVGTVAGDMVFIGTVEAEVVVDTALSLFGGELAAVGREVHGGRAVVATVGVGGVNRGHPWGRGRCVLVAGTGTRGRSGVWSPGGCGSGCGSVGGVCTVLVVDLLTEVHKCIEAGWFVDGYPKCLFDLVAESSLQGG